MNYAGRRGVQSHNHKTVSVRGQRRESIGIERRDYSRTGLYETAELRTHKIILRTPRIAIEIVICRHQSPLIMVFLDILPVNPGRRHHETDIIDKSPGKIQISSYS